MKPLEPKQSLLLDSYTFLELLYHTIVREVRSESGSAMLGLLGAMGRTLLMVAIFYFLFAVLGMRGSIIRGDVILFLLTGVGLFFLHNGTVSRTMNAGSSVGPLMQHAPMTTALAISASVIAHFYVQILAIGLILLCMFLLGSDIGMYNPAGLMLPVILAWASGIVIGLLLLMVKPFSPKTAQLISVVYMRANMITSGKFFVANMLPNHILPFFLWNPLFHSIDQARGAMFVNYVPRNTSIEFALYFVTGGIVLGLMGEFWLRRTVSKSTAS